MGFSGSCDVVASRDMSDLIAFLELLSLMERGKVWVEPTFGGGVGAGSDGNDGRSVVQASQQR